MFTIRAKPKLQTHVAHSPIVPLYERLNWANKKNEGAKLLPGQQWAVITSDETICRCLCLPGIGQYRESDEVNLRPDIIYSGYHYHLSIPYSLIYDREIKLGKKHELSAKDLWIFLFLVLLSGIILKCRELQLL